MFICGHLKIKNPYFFSQDRDDVVGYPFILGIQMQWQFEAMLRWAHHGAISMDATFGTNHMKFHLFTLMVFDDFRNGVPIAWIITSRQKEEDLIQWLTALRAKAMKVQPEWRPSCFIVDDAIHERNAIKYVIFPCDFLFALNFSPFIFISIITIKFSFCIHFEFLVLSNIITFHII